METTRWLRTDASGGHAVFVHRQPVVACSCSSYEPVKACQIFRQTPVIFRGRVIDYNDDPTAGFAQMTLYRFKVLESFKGLPPGTKEVFIDPASGTSCYTHFSLDHDYLIYAGGAQPAPAAVTVLRGPGPNTPTNQSHLLAIHFLT